MGSGPGGEFGPIPGDSKGMEGGVSVRRYIRRQDQRETGKVRRDGVIPKLFVRTDEVMETGELVV